MTRLGPVPVLLLGGGALGGGLASSCAPDAGAAPSPAPAALPAPAAVEAPLPPPRPAPAPAADLRTSAKSLPIRAAPAPDAPLRGFTGEGASFRVVRAVPDGAPGCAAGWAELEAKGFL